MIAPSIVLFAIQSAIKLGAQSREAYVDATRRREILLPLPKFNPSPGIGAARIYFRRERPQIKGPKRLLELLDKVDAKVKLTKLEQEELVTFHSECLLLNAKGTDATLLEDGSRLTDYGLNALVSIRQWRRGSDPNPSTLQRLAGTFVEIGVDYFADVPGALKTDSKHGKALHAFFTGLDDISFSTEPLGDLPSKLFVSTVEVISENSEVLTSDPKIQELITVTTKSLVTDVNRRIEQIRAHAPDSLLEDRVYEWGELVFRSILASGGRLVIENPKKFLGMDDKDHGALVTHVGDAVLGLVLDQPKGQLDSVFGREALETVVKAALTAVGKHPAILVDTKNVGLKMLLSEVAGQLGQYDTLLTPDILPEMIRLILDKTGENLPLLWPDLATDPRKNLLLTGAATTLDILTREPADGDRWKPRFNRDDLIAVSEAVLDEFVENPGWLVHSSGAVNQNLKIALEAAIGVLRRRGDARLSTKTASDILHACLKAVAVQAEFLEELPNGQPVITAILDAVFDTVFDEGLDPKAAWSLVRNEVIRGVVNISLQQLTKAGLTEGNIKKLKPILDGQVTIIMSGKPWDLFLFEAKLSKALAQA
jgi:hypothetical protein